MGAKLSAGGALLRGLFSRFWCLRRSAPARGRPAFFPPGGAVRSLTYSIWRFAGAARRTGGLREDGLAGRDGQFEAALQGGGQSTTGNTDNIYNTLSTTRNDPRNAERGPV